MAEIDSPRAADPGDDDRRQRTGLVTLLFTDMVGSTALKQRLGDLASSAFFDEHHQIVRQNLARSASGREIETAGDSFLITFDKPSDAIKFALLLQTQLRVLSLRENAGALDRIGIHVGEVVIKEDQPTAKPRDLFGIPIDTCARIMSLATGGQTLMSRFAFDTGRPMLRGDQFGALQWLNHGLYQLKGIDEPIEVCEVRPAGSATSPPTNSDKASRLSTDGDLVLGWRPALEQTVPNTKWILEEKLGEGGFGEVWLGRHQTTKERRVFKFCFRADRVRSLKREMTLFRLLKEAIGDHPNIVALRDVFFDEPPFYVVMDYVEGGDLKSWSEERGGVATVPLEARLEIVAQVADALQAAHDAGVIHRDVKPGNILISQLSTANSQPTAKLTDFGIGQVVSQEALAGMTKAGFTQTMMSDSSSSQTGSQMYMAPELFAGKPASTRSDIYSLGVVLYQLVVGDLACPLTTDWGKKIADPLLREDLEHCFAGNPGDRFPGAEQLAKNLRALPLRQVALDRQKADQVLREQVQRAAQKRHKIVVLASGIAIGLLVIIVAMGYGLKRAQRAERETKRQLYVSDMIVAGNALNEGHIQQVETLLDSYLQKPGTREDLRGFEYYYLRQQCLGEQAFTFPPQERAVFGVAYSPDGKMLATASSYQDGKRDYSGSLKLFDYVSRKEIHTFVLLGPTGIPISDGIRSVVFSPDGKILASGSAGSVVTIWDAVGATHQKLGSFFGGGEPAIRMAFSPDSSLLAAQFGGRIVLWDTMARKETKVFASNNSAMAFSRDGKTLALADGNTLHVWDRASQRFVAEIVLPFDGAVYCLDFSSDSKTVGFGVSSGFVALWEIEAKQITRLGKHQSEVISAAFSRDGRQLATSSADGTINLWDPAGQKPLRMLKGHRDSVEQVVFSPGGTHLASASHDKTVRLWPVAPAETGILGRHAKGVVAVDFSPDGKLLASASGERGVKIWDPIKQDLRQTLTGFTNDVESLAFSPDGKYLAAGCFEWTIKLWDTGTWREATNITCILKDRGPGSAPGLRFSPDGKFLVAAEIGVAEVWEAGSWRAVTNLVGAGGAVALTRDTVATAGGGTPAVKLWEVRTWRLLRSLPGHNKGINTLTFTPNGQTLITGSDDSTMNIWDVSSGQMEATLKGHAGGVRALAVSPDGRTLAASDMSGAIKLWNLATGKELFTLSGHEASVSSLAFSPDGMTLASGSSDRTVRLWQTAIPVTSNAPAERQR